MAPPVRLTPAALVQHHGTHSSPRRCCAMVLASVSGGSGHATRCYARATKAAVKRIIDQQNAADDRRDFRSARQDRTTMREVIRRRGPMLIPATFVPQPFSDQPRSPRQFLQYQKWRVTHWLSSATKQVLLKLSSMPSWTRRPQFKLGRGKLAPTAKAMYAEAMHAFAAGDAETIRKLCWPMFADRLTRAVEIRDPKSKTHFEITAYNKPLFYPRVVSRRIEPMHELGMDKLVDQVVVAIASTQVASRSSTTTGEVIPGSTKVQEKIEYVCMSRIISDSTWELGDWRLFGTLSPSSYKEYEEAMALYNAEMNRHMGLKKSSKPS